MDKEHTLKTKQTVISCIKIGASVGIVALGFVCSFPELMRRRVIESQAGRCAECQDSDPLQVHHIVPQCMGGRDTIQNAVAFCDPCHNIWDRRAIREEIIWPGIPLSQATDEQRYKRGEIPPRSSKRRR